MRAVLMLGLHYPEAAASETVFSGASPPKYLPHSCLIAKEWTHTHNEWGQPGQIKWLFQR